MNKNLNYQDTLLNAVRKGAMPIVVFLTSGYQLKGIVRAFDNYVIMLETDGKQQMIYKHAISTIVPSKNVKINYTNDEEQEMG